MPHVQGGQAMLKQAWSVVGAVAQAQSHALWGVLKVADCGELNGNKSNAELSLVPASHPHAVGALILCFLVLYCEKCGG